MFCAQSTGASIQNNQLTIKKNNNNNTSNLPVEQIGHPFPSGLAQAREHVTGNGGHPLPLLMLLSVSPLPASVGLAAVPGDTAVGNQVQIQTIDLWNYGPDIQLLEIRFKFKQLICETIARMR